MQKSLNYMHDKTNLWKKQMLSLKRLYGILKQWNKPNQIWKKIILLIFWYLKKLKICITKQLYENNLGI